MFHVYLSVANSSFNEKYIMTDVQVNEDVWVERSGDGVCPSIHSMWIDLPNVEKCKAFSA